MSKHIDLTEEFNQSFEFINDNNERFYSCFYANFLVCSPHITEIFKGVDLEKQKPMLEKAILNLVYFSSSKIIDSDLINLAMKHHKLGISADMYDLFMVCFLKTLEQTYPRYNPFCGLAWRMVLSPGITCMQYIPALYLKA